MAKQKEPPLMIDGARVVEYALLDASRIPPGQAKIAAAGVPLDLGNVAGVLVAENLADGGFFLVYCNDRWETLTASAHSDRAAARQAAEQAHAGIATQWTPFRELTAEEAAEVRSTRAFLKQLAADFPNA